MRVKTNVVVVGRATGDESWNRVILSLRNRGFNVSAMQASLASLDEDIIATRELLASSSDPTVLVADSHCGTVVTASANGQSNVTALVYVAAFGLVERESLDSRGERIPSWYLPSTNDQDTAEAAGTAGKTLGATIRAEVESQGCPQSRFSQVAEIIALAAAEAANNRRPATRLARTPAPVGRYQDHGRDSQWRFYACPATA